MSAAERDNVYPTGEPKMPVACREEPQNLGVSLLLAWRRALVWFVCLCRKGVEIYGKYVVARAGQGKLSYLLGCFRGSADRCVYCC